MKKNKKLSLIISVIAILLPQLSFAQDCLPSYLDVLNKFLATYSHEREEQDDRVILSKKRDGWYVNIADIIKNDSIKSKQLFWKLSEQKYQPLSGFAPAQTKAEVEAKIETFLNGNDAPFLYGYERCRYFGYSQWDVDMINDFGNRLPANDTLLEGLSRAYSAYAERFLWNNSGIGSYGNDHIIQKLGRMEIPDKLRTDSFTYYIKKSIDGYNELDRRNPGFKLLVGNPGMKVLNEELHGFQQLMICGYKKEANKLIADLSEDDTTYFQIGYTYLNACPPNSILITFGDNDTYPLWYLQEKKGFRKDVTVINNSILNYGPYINMIKRDKLIQFSSTLDFYGRDNFDYFPYDETGPPNITRKSIGYFLTDLQKLKYPVKGNIDSLPSYQVKTIDFTIDIPKIKRICNQNNFTNTITVELNNYLLLNDLIIMDIVNSNIYSRPIYFTSPYTIFNKKYFQQEGPVHRLLPVNEQLNKANTLIEVTKTEAYLNKNYSPVLAEYYDSEKYYEEALYGVTSGQFAKIITYYVNSKNETKANEWASKYLNNYHSRKIRHTLSDYVVAEAILKTSYSKKGVEIIEAITTSILNEYNTGNCMGFIHTKKTVKEYLEYFNNLLTSNNFSSTLLENKIAEISKEEDMD